MQPIPVPLNSKLKANITNKQASKQTIKQTIQYNYDELKYFVVDCCAYKSADAPGNMGFVVDALLSVLSELDVLCYVA